MSKFTPTSSFKNFKTSNSIPIIFKSDKKKPKNKPMPNKPTQSNLSDKEFELLMEENCNINESTNDKKISLYTIPIFENKNKFLMQLLESKLLGTELKDFVNINYNNVQEFGLLGLELLDTLLLSHTDPKELDWIGEKQYGSVLEFLFENNIKEQVIALLMIQNYCKIHGFIKIPLKTSEAYLIRVMFQMFFTSGIIDESSYYKWQECLEENKIDEQTKKLLLVQTSEFFMILNTVFADDEDEDENENENNQNNNKELKQNNQHKNTNEYETESDSESDSIDKDEKRKIDEYNGNNNYSYTGTADEDFSLDDL